MGLAHTLRVDETPPESFWTRLEEASRDVGLPYGLSDIGRELDIWPSAVQKWRDGTSLPYEKNLILLATNRGVNTEWLKTGRGDKLAKGAMDSGTRELLTIWAKLPAEAQLRLLGAARYERNVITAPEPPAPPGASPDPSSTLSTGTVTLLHSRKVSPVR